MKYHICGFLCSLLCHETISRVQRETHFFQKIIKCAFQKCAFRFCLPHQCYEYFMRWEKKKKKGFFLFFLFRFSNSWSCAGDVAICLQHLLSVKVSVLAPHCYTWISPLPEHTAVRAPGAACGCHKLGTLMLCWFMLPQELLWSAGIFP